jgi:hypothetical protein
VSVSPPRATRCRSLTAVVILSVTALALSYAGLPHPAEDSGNSTLETFLGFDRNEYPGDGTLPVLRRTFSFTGYWLNIPPGAKANSWAGKRAAVRSAGFGFLLLFNGRLDAEIRKAASAAFLGRSDADAAVAAASREGFPKGRVIFLDQEEGGLMLPEQKAYIYSWIDGVNTSGYRAGIYCSGLASPAGNASVVTANDLRENAAGRTIEFWVANDSCPPSPGCSYAQKPPLPSASGTRFATVWQYAQSPRRRDFARRCTNYAADENCYPPGLVANKIFVDLDSATSPDPSNSR